MKLARKNESGQIFVLVLILLAIGPLLILPMLHLSYSAQRFHQIVEIITLNDNAADSGVEWGKYQVYNYPMEIIDASPPGLEWNLVINGIDVHVHVEYDRDMAAYVITSTASRAQRSSTIECVIVIDVGLFGNVAAVDGDLDIQYCEFVNEDFPGESDIYTNGNISIIGSAADPSLVDGDATASGNVTVGDHSEVTGTIEEGAEAIEFPPIDAEVHEDKAKADDDIRIGDVTLGTGTHYLGPTYIYGNLSIVGHPTKGNAKVTLEGTVYVTGTVTIDLAELYGFGDIVTEGDISITRTLFDLDIVDYLPLLFSVYGDIYISGDGGNTFIQEIMYAPAPDAQLSLIRVDAYGSVAAKYILLDHSTLKYPAELRGRADLPGAGLDTVTYQFK